MATTQRSNNFQLQKDRCKRTEKCEVTGYPPPEAHMWPLTRNQWMKQCSLQLKWCSLLRILAKREHKNWKNHALVTQLKQKINGDGA